MSIGPAVLVQVKSRYKQQSSTRSLNMDAAAGSKAAHSILRQAMARTLHQAAIAAIVCLHADWADNHDSGAQQLPHPLVQVQQEANSLPRVALYSANMHPQIIPAASHHSGPCSSDLFPPSTSSSQQLLSLSDCRSQAVACLYTQPRLPALDGRVGSW